MCKRVCACVHCALSVLSIQCTCVRVYWCIGCVCVCVCTCVYKLGVKRGSTLMNTSGHELWQLTSQYSVSLSSVRSPLASSKRKSRLMNFLNPQSFPGQCNTPSDSLHTRDREGSRRSNNTCTHKYTHLHIHTCTNVHTHTHTHTHTHPHHRRWQQLITRITQTHSTNAQYHSLIHCLAFFLLVV